MLLALTLSLFVQSTVPPARPDAEVERERMRQLVRELGREAVRTEGVPGIAIAVSRDGQIVAQAAMGWADPENGIVVEESTRFPVGSLTRQFTAARVLQLAKEELLALDDPLEKHLPAFQSPNPPTLRQVLAGRSGIVGWKALLAAHPEAAGAEVTEERFVALLAKTPRAFAPGASHDDDSLGYALLALVVQRVEGRPFEKCLRTTVIEPAGLESTGFCPAAPRHPGFAADCSSADEAFDCELPAAASLEGATRGLCTTAADVLRWQEALHAGKVLDDGALKLFFAPSGKEKSPDEHGCAVRTGRMEDQVVHAHSGASGGFRVRAAYYPETKVGIVVLANCATAEVERIEQELARVAHGFAPFEGEFPLTAAEERRLPGTYQLATTQLRVFIKEGHLWLEEPGKDAVHLSSLGRGEFKIGEEKEARLVFDLEGGRAEWFLLMRGGTQSRAMRTDGDKPPN